MRPMTLGQMIAAFDDADDKLPVRVDAPIILAPGVIRGYRGDYAALAIACEATTVDKLPTVLEMRKRLQKCVNRTFPGYKGGAFTMSEKTPVWIANYSESSHHRVVAIRVGPCYVRIVSRFIGKVWND